MGAPTEIVALAFAVSLACTLILLPFAMRVSGILGLVTQPGGRHVHSTPIPRTGGLAILGGVLCSWLVWPVTPPPLLVTCCVLLSVACLGYLDDRFDIRARYELGAQICASVVVVAAWFLALPVHQPYLLLLAPCAVLFLVGVTNAINMSDGLDGLAAGSTLLMYAVLALLAFQIGTIELAVLAVSLVGGLVGFLAFNTHPAKIFMGDAGSQFLGFGAAAVAVALVAQPQFAASPAMFVLLFGVPILDTAMVIVLRWRAGTSIFAADKNHIHHQLLAKGFSQPQVVAVMYALKAVAVSLAYFLRYEYSAIILLVYGLFAGIVVLWLAWGGRGDAQAASAVGRERRNPLFRGLVGVHRYAHACIAGAMGLAMLTSAWFLRVPDGVDGGMLVVAAAGLAALWFLVWRSANVVIARLIFLLCAGTVAWLYWLGADGRPVFNAGVDLMFAGLAVFLALAIRVTRKEVFALDAQDYLVLLLAGLLAAIAWADSSMLNVVRVALRPLLLLFAAEFVFIRGRKAANILIMSSILSIALLGGLHMAV